MHVVRNFAVDSGSEEYGIYSATTFTQNSLNWKAGIRTNASPAHTSGTLAKIVGMQSLISSGSSGGTTTDAMAHWSRVDTLSGQIITNAYGYYMENGSGSGNPLNQYGIYIQPLTKGTNENYAIYSAGTTKSFFGGNVGIGTSAPSATLEVAGDVIRTLAHSSGNLQDDINSGQVGARTLVIVKRKMGTSLRIGWTDSRRVVNFSGVAAACRWEIKVDGVSCVTPLIFDQHSTNNSDPVAVGQVVGFCGGVGAGSRTISIWVSPISAYPSSDCLTGWSNTTWSLEAEEIN